MGIYRLYTGTDGQSHIDQVDLGRRPELKSATPATSIMFQESAPGYFVDWHPAPRRQYIILLSGQLEIGLGDGSRHVFGPGDARLVEDTTGHGHTTRVVGRDPAITAVIPLAG